MDEEQIKIVKEICTAPDARKKTIGELAKEIQAKIPTLDEKDAEASVITAGMMIAVGAWG